MPFIPNTPESLLRRADSKNPATTCKGITTSGIHCRRSIASPRSSLVHFPVRKFHKDHDGVLAILEPDEGADDGAAAFFCWQHKDQATSLTNAPHGNRTASIVELKSRTSQDTLVERLGVLSVASDGNAGTKKHSKRDWEMGKPPRKDTLPKKWQDVDGPLLAVHEKRGQTIRQPPERRAERRKTEVGLLSALCCLKMPDIEEELPMRPHQNNQKTRPAELPATKPDHAPRPVTQHLASNTRPPSTQQTPKRASHSSPIRQTPSQPMTSPGRPKPNRDPPSETQNLLSLVPKSLSPQTTSLLLAELAKPISPHDEAGYIYIFWLTEADQIAPEKDEVSYLVEAKPIIIPVTTKQERRRASIMGPSTAAKKANPKVSTHIMLKIGRASNVQRRMNEWSRQCGYHLSLMRFYPYAPSSPTSSSSSPRAPSPLSLPLRRHSHLAPSGPTKVPNVQKVERLIHLELAGLRVKRGCEGCGRCHQEWFEVPNSTEAIKAVDEVVRRWVDWAERGGK